MDNKWRFAMKKITCGLAVQDSELLSSGMSDFEDKLFGFPCDAKENLSIDKFKSLLNEAGLRNSDHRLKETTDNFHDVEVKQLHDENELRGMVNRDTFKECVTENIVLISRAFKNQFIILEWRTFTNQIKQIYDKVAKNKNGTGKSALLGMCRVHCGWTESTVKPLLYALVLNDLTPEVVHKFVGQEPSGKSFNELTLDYQHKPHNHMINAGAIVVSSIADRFVYNKREAYIVAMCSYIQDTARVDDGTTQASDRRRTFSLLQLRLCSIEVTCESGSVIAATLANGGICPMTGEVVLCPEAARYTLSLMRSCGTYDYSGQFAFKVGLPSKSGVAGAIMLVVPNVMGIFLWAPPLDQWGNSCKGVEFCEELVGMFNFHNYDNLTHTQKKINPRGRAMESKAQDVVNLLFSAYYGDFTAIRRYSLLGMDMALADYDGRTALHLAAAEGHIDIVKFLLEKCQVSPYIEDRWGCTPSEDAKKFEHDDVAVILQKYMSLHLDRDVQYITAKIKNLPSD